MPTESTFLLAGLFLLLAAAGWAMGRFGERDEEQPPPPLNIDYLKGLNFLLNEQTDQALEHFLEMVRVDDKTIETHFALGSLFRRRGEVDRAIRIHQNIIARPDLAAEQRDQALYSLAKDYLHAGLLDRAENLFSRLSQGSRYQVQALESLCRIYEQEKEWERAVDAAEKLEVLGGRSLALQIAHYYCELAEAAAQRNDYSAARAYVKKAQTGRPRTMRGALTRAHIAQETHDSKTALRLYHRLIDENTYLIAEALPEIVAIYTREDEIAEGVHAQRAHAGRIRGPPAAIGSAARRGRIGAREDPQGPEQTGKCVTALPVPGMRVLQSASPLAVSELPQLGDPATGFARTVRYDSATQHHELLSTSGTCISGGSPKFCGLYPRNPLPKLRYRAPLARYTPNW
jgi:lipopolysaccharide biosynthesis regulator YciM